MAVKFKNLAGGHGEEVHLVIEGDWLARKGAKITHVDTGKTLALIQGAKWKLSEKILVDQLVRRSFLHRSSWSRRLPFPFSLRCPVPCYRRPWCRPRPHRCSRELLRREGAFHFNTCISSPARGFGYSPLLCLISQRFYG